MSKQLSAPWRRAIRVVSEYRKWHPQLTGNEKWIMSKWVYTRLVRTMLGPVSIGPYTGARATLLDFPFEVHPDAPRNTLYITVDIALRPPKRNA